MASEEYEISDIEKIGVLSQANEKNATSYAYRPKKEETANKFYIDHDEHIERLAMNLRGYYLDKRKNEWIKKEFSKQLLTDEGTDRLISTISIYLYKAIETSNFEYNEIQERTIAICLPVADLLFLNHEIFKIPSWPDYEIINTWVDITVKAVLNKAKDGWFLKENNKFVNVHEVSDNKTPQNTGLMGSIKGWWS